MLQHPKIKTIIDAEESASILNFRELWLYRDLLYFMVLRDITVLYKQTVLGFAWAIINPLFQIVVFSLVFGRLVGVNPDAGNMPYPIFSCLAIIPWTYFSNSLNDSATSLIASNHILSKVYFPRLIFPLVPVISKLVDLSISFVILIGLMFFFKYQPGVNVVYVLIPLVLVIITSAGLGLWFSALSVQYRDFKFALKFTMPLLMYLAPVAFPASIILNKLGNTVYHLYAIYPLVGVIEGFRGCFSHTPMPWNLIAISYTSALVILISGLYYYKKMERYFADVV